MDEKDFRETLTKEELEARAYIIPFKVVDFELLEDLNRISKEFYKTWDELINIAITRFISDIDYIKDLRK